MGTVHCFPGNGCLQLGAAGLDGLQDSGFLFFLCAFSDVVDSVADPFRDRRWMGRPLTVVLSGHSPGFGSVARQSDLGLGSGP